MTSEKSFHAEKKENLGTCKCLSLISKYWLFVDILLSIISAITKKMNYFLSLFVGLSNDLLLWALSF